MCEREREREIWWLVESKASFGELRKLSRGYRKENAAAGVKSLMKVEVCCRKPDSKDGGLKLVRVFDG